MDGVVLAKGITVKKVRYAAGALGALGMLPATALLAPAATAATAHPARTTHGKSVRLASRVARAACNARHTHTSSTNIRGYISYSKDTGCIAQIIGHRYNGASAGLEMRVRFYSGGVQQIPTRYVHGHIHNSHNSVSFVSTPIVSSIQQVCETIVYSTTKVELSSVGIVCQRTGFTSPSGRRH